MKNLLTAVMITLFCLGGIVVSSCTNDDDYIRNLKFSVDKLELSPTATFKVTIENGTAPFNAKSVNDGTVSVKVDGNVLTITGEKVGRTSIIVSDANKLSGTLPVKVTMPLLVSKHEVKVAVGKEEAFQVKTGLPPYEVRVQDKGIASVTVRDNVVIVKGIKAGMTFLTVTDRENNSNHIAVIVR